ncbi:nicotianamine synthase family protein [Paenibacillus oryzisoli]|uniref:rRNA methyltransferase n=1 Tax=Paenibacillus oryzisoli TaxID=1850517 RepID=A0A198A095_9BACL|nr:nicotianamine synthase family protein [Paenibacillus oryzisoli]OAS14879.1 rRNA methyltransferase [Paenibacillus oryzisoli]
MQTAVTLQSALVEYYEEFDGLVSGYDQTLTHSSALEDLINRYSDFITNSTNKELWEELKLEKLEELTRLVEALRMTSAQAVAHMEKYRAFRLQEGMNEISDYFINIETCIDQEFGSSQVTPDSKVLFIGSGSFPMTPLLIAKRTGAVVVGIDIDEESIALGKLVVEKLGPQFNIRLEKTVVADLPFTKEATHIIFSSTVPIKYELLDQLHELTNENVVVAMRYGNGLKSLFNYPMHEVDMRKWVLVDTIVRPDHVFDVALYIKA